MCQVCMCIFACALVSRSKPLYKPFKIVRLITIIQTIQNNNNNNNNPYRLVLPGGKEVSHPDHEIELHASPNVNLETE